MTLRISSPLNERNSRKTSNSSNSSMSVDIEASGNFGSTSYTLDAYSGSNSRNHTLTTGNLLYDTIEKTESSGSSNG